MPQQEVSHQARSVKNVLGHTLDRLGEDIVAGRHACGSSLPPEASLCAQLGVSRTVVREAVKSLVAKGLLSTGPKVGTRVLASERWNWFDADVVQWQTRAGLTREFLREVQELRRIIEPAAVAMAASRVTAQDIAELEQAYAGMCRAVAEGGDYVSHDLAFHQGLLRASHNRLVQQVSRAIGALLRTSFEISTARPAQVALSLPLHRAVLDAVIASQPQLAQQASLDLIDSAQADIDRVLASRRKLPSLVASAKPLRAPRLPQQTAQATLATQSDITRPPTAASPSGAAAKTRGPLR